MRKLLLLILFFLHFKSIAQWSNNVWCFGDSARINFTAIGPVADSCSLDTRGTCTSIADANDNLLFYTGSDPQATYTNNYFWNGDVYNSNDTIMENGDSIITRTWYNENIIIPNPANNNKYYLFTAGVTTILGFYYSVIDLNYNGGLGKVTQKNVQLLSSSMISCIAAVKHGNGRDWWVITKEFNSMYNDTVTEYLVTPNGISNQIKIKIGTPSFASNCAYRFSNDGQNLMFYTAAGLIEVYKFDRCTGFITDPINIRTEPTSFIPLGIWGASFSPNDSLLYISNYYPPSYIIQYNLFAPNIASSVDTIGYITGTVPNSYRSSANIKAAPDGKIYVACVWYDSIGNPNYPYPDSAFYPDNMYLATIDSPNVDGMGCQFNPYGFYLGGKRAYWGLPNNPDYMMGADLGSPCDSLTSIDADSENNPNKIFLFPNPVHDKLYLSLAEDESVKVIITDITGRKVLQQQINIGVIDVTKLANGIYVVDVFNKGEKINTSKIVKQ